MAVDVAQMEAAIKELRSIVSARVFVNGDEDSVSQIHVLSSVGRGTKRLVRDIESILLTRFDMRIDHRKISIAQMDPEDAGQWRLRFHKVWLEMSGGTSDVRVELAWGERILQGQATGVMSEFNRLRLTAQATVAAIRNGVSPDLGLLSDHVRRVPVQDRTAIVVTLTALSDGVEEHLMGAAYVRRDEFEAVIRATLSAANRRLLQWLNPGNSSELAVNS